MFHSKYINRLGRSCNGFIERFEGLIQCIFSFLVNWFPFETSGKKVQSIHIVVVINGHLKGFPIGGHGNFFHGVTRLHGIVDHGFGVVGILAPRSDRPFGLSAPL